MQLAPRVASVVVLALAIALCMASAPTAAPPLAQLTSGLSPAADRRVSPESIQELRGRLLQARARLQLEGLEFLDLAGDGVPNLPRRQAWSDLARHIEVAVAGLDASSASRTQGASTTLTAQLDELMRHQQAYLAASTDEARSAEAEEISRLLALRPFDAPAVEPPSAAPAPAAIPLARPLRLWVRTAAGLEPAAHVVEGLPMVVDVAFAEEGARALTLEVSSGSQELALEARPASASVPAADANAGDPWRSFSRSSEFVVTRARGITISDQPTDDGERRQPTAEDWASIAGVWKTVYRDAVLGTIDGWARISPEGAVAVRHWHPEEKRWHELQLRSALILRELPLATDDADRTLSRAPERRWMLEFDGGVAAPRAVPESEPPNRPQLRLEGDGGDGVSFEAQDVSAVAPVQLRDEPDRDRIRLELTAQEGDVLEWSWTYAADRATGRDANGDGRIGLLLPPLPEDASVATMAGREAWARARPEVAAAFCLDDQLALETDRSFDGRPVERYRFAPRARSVRLANGTSFEDVLPSSGNLTRRVFVVARGLPPLDVAPLEVRPVDGGGVREYRVLARGGENDSARSKELAAAWNEYRRRVPRESELGAGKADAVQAEGLLLLAVLDPQAGPGMRPLVVQGTSTSWRLLFGDCVGELDVVRRTSMGDQGEADELEETAKLFVPERFHVSIRAGAPVPQIAGIRVALAAGKTSAEAAASAPVLIDLRPDPEDPRRYLSRPIELVRTRDVERARSQQPGAIVIGAESGDALHAMVEAEAGYLVTPVSLSVPILDSPERVGRLWKTAVERAAELADRPIHDWSEVVRAEAGAATNFIFTEYVVNSPLTGIGAFTTGMEELTRMAARYGIRVPLSSWWQREAGGRDGLRRIPISVGDHAAVLLLRAELVEMLREHKRDWERNRAPATVRAIFEAQRDAVAARRSPLSFAQVSVQGLPQLEGRAVDERYRLHELFTDAFLVDELGLHDDGTGFEELRRRAFARAFDAWGESMDGAIAEAEAIPDSDVDALLKLAGHGFEPVVRRLMPQLLEIEDDRELVHRAHWVPDRVARAFVGSLEVLGEAVRAQESYSEVDSNVALAAASIASIPLGNAGGFWTALAAFGVSTVDLAHSMYTDWWLNDERERELAFEVGAGAVLGYRRAGEVDESIVAGGRQALSIGGSLLGVAADAFPLVRAVRALKPAYAADRAAKVIAQVDFADPAALRVLGAEERMLLLRYAEEAQDVARRNGRQALDAAQVRALDNKAAIDAAAARPAASGAPRPKPRAIGTIVRTPGGMAAVPRQINDNTCGISVVRAAVQRLTRRVIDEVELIRRSLLTGRGYKTGLDLASGRLAEGGAWPAELIEMLDDCGVATRTPFGRKFRPTGLEPAANPKLAELEFTLDDAAREIRDGNAVMAVVDYVRYEGRGESPHWVVIEQVGVGFKQGKTVIDGPFVVIGDPARGVSVAIARDDFLKHWRPEATVIALHPENALAAPLPAKPRLLPPSGTPRPAGPRPSIAASSAPLPHYVDEARAFLRRSGHPDAEQRLAELIDVCDDYLVRSARGLDPTTDSRVFNELVERLEDLSPELLQKFVARIRLQQHNRLLFLGGRVADCVPDELGFPTTTHAMRVKARTSPYRDPLEFSKKEPSKVPPLGLIEPDHIYPVSRIVNRSGSSDGLRGFSELERELQMQVVHNLENVQPLTPWMNKLKSNRSIDEWNRALANANERPLSADYVEWLEGEQRRLAELLQDQIDALLRRQAEEAAEALR